MLNVLLGMSEGKLDVRSFFLFFKFLILKMKTAGYFHFLEVSSNLLVKLTLKEMLDTMVVVVTTPVG